MVMGRASSLNDEQEFCPSCGNFFDQLNEDTGWCPECSGTPSSNSCLRCGDPISEESQRRDHCSKCRKQIWLENNADAIEIVMATEIVTVAKAKETVRANNRPICLSCKKPIKGGTNGKSFFCTTTTACKVAHERYVRHHYNGLSHEESVIRALTAALVIKLKTGKNK